MNNRTLDRIAGIFFTLLGMLIVLGAWNMPRFEAQGAKIYETPGFTPALLGVALVICGLALAFRPNNYLPQDATMFWDQILGHPLNQKRALWALFLTLSYGALLFGKIPFVLATFIFVFAFISLFELMLSDEDVKVHSRRKLKTLIVAFFIAVIVSVAVELVFEKLFLITLPGAV